jgi:quinoprotein glucose dehydrogenase
MLAKAKKSVLINLKSTLLVIIGLLFIYSCNDNSKEHKILNNVSWEIYGGSNEKTHYINSLEINISNVNQLKQLWEYKTGDQDDFTQIQTNSIIIGENLFGVSPKLKLFSLNAKNGSHLWTFDPFLKNIDKSKIKGYFSMNVCRGVTYYENDLKESFIFYAVGSKLYSINAKTGKTNSKFGSNGFVDLHIGLGERAKSLYIAMTSPGVIYKNLIIIGSRVNESKPAAPGNIRAFNADTGNLVWVFNTIPKEGEEGHESWDDPEAWKTSGGANSWAGFSLDYKTGVLYAPTGSASYDFYGSDRLGDNLYANSIIAINASDGKKIWHYQTVHHDVWDRDLPTAPVLLEYKKENEIIPALAQISKSGFVYLLNRVTGKPIFPIIEKKVPTKTNLLGEKLSPTQPIPDFPNSFSRQKLDLDELNPFISKIEAEELKKKLASYKKDNMFAAPSTEGTVIFPGYDGGGEWGGPAYDPENQWLYVNANEMAWILTMKTVNNDSNTPQSLYQNQCMMCHGTNFKGSGDNPSLLNLKKRYTKKSLKSLISNGRRMMPGFGHLDLKKIDQLSEYIYNLNDKSQIDLNIKNQTGYVSTGYNKFLTSDGYPAISLPWGTLNAINLNSGKIEWKIPFGETPIGNLNNMVTGSENYGGPIVTSSGLLFIAATKDRKFRAFNKISGDLLWEVELPYAGYATPSFYQINGKSYIVIACGGGKLGSPSGDSYIAFGLP